MLDDYYATLRLEHWQIFKYFSNNFVFVISQPGIIYVAVIQLYIPSVSAKNITLLTSLLTPNVYNSASLLITLLTHYISFLLFFFQFLQVACTSCYLTTEGITWSKTVTHFWQQQKRLSDWIHDSVSANTGSWWAHNTAVNVCVNS